MDALFADLGGARDTVVANQLEDATLFQAVTTAREHLSATGLSAPDLRDVLHVAEPFRSNWTRVETILDELDETGASDVR
jgi:hypothetical protein